MALNKKGSNFGFDMEERLNRVIAKPEQQECADPYADTDAYMDNMPAQKENRSKRLYLLCQPSVHQKIDTYAKLRGDKFNNVVHKMMEEFIEKHNL